MNIWFWQRMITPHMSYLASELAAKGNDVTYVAESELSEARKNLGWTVPPLAGVRLIKAPILRDVLTHVAAAPSESIHICQGIRSNGLVGCAQLALGRRGLRQWAILETVNDAGALGVAKRLVYSNILRRRSQWLSGVFAIGSRTSSWLIGRGLPEAKAVPFAYFLPTRPSTPSSRGGAFTFIFVGELVDNKNVDLLIRALASLKAREFDLHIIGHGPRAPSLRRLATALLPGRVQWRGRLPIDQVQFEMVNSDCLVLPSNHDGWGAVISEAMLVGTPVVCSDSCGAADVVMASGCGTVFRRGDIAGLTAALAHQLVGGRVDDVSRTRLRDWSYCLSAPAGASYLHEVLAGDGVRVKHLVPPWRQLGARKGA